MSNVIDLPGGWGRLRPCRHGLFVYNPRDVYIGRSLDLYGEYSEAEVRVLCSLVRPGDAVVEAGANIGALTIALAKAAGADGVVLAYEPQRLAHQILCANAALNGLVNVVARQAAVGAAPGTAHVPVLNPEQEYNFGDVVLAQWTAETGVPVPVETIDERGLSRCRLIKADVQGMELEVLKGAERTIARHRPALYVENDVRARSPALIAYVRSLGYRLWWHLPPLFDAGNWLGASENVFGNVISVNLLCFPAEADIELDADEVLGEDDWPVVLR